MLSTAEAFDTRLETFAIKVGQRWTTIRLEPELMDALRAIARASGSTVNQIATAAATSRTKGSFTSALRVFILNYYRWGGARAAIAPGPTFQPAQFR
jgi:predicted DNA-binding ribbon-helix-helix protein